jgi:serine/threonine protein kinase
MAELTVMGDFQGPGERKTASVLARELPDSWHVIAGRKLAGARRDDLDLVVVGEHAVFLLEEKAWGPRIDVGDQFWKVKGGERRNPLDRVNHLARVLAGQLRERVPGYKSAVRGRRIVIAAVVLSYDGVEVVADSTAAEDEPVILLADAAHWLTDQDALWGNELGQVRNEIVSFLVGLPGQDSKPEMIGVYKVVEEIEPIEGARCFHAKYDDKVVLLRCYPTYGRLAEDQLRLVVERERVALDRLEERDRTWQIHPSFEYEPRQWTVVPVVPAKGKNLATSVRIGDPKRDGGRLPQQVMIDVVTDAFRGLAEVHEAGLLHRALYPRRIFLGRGLRVKFADFYLARVSGEKTITPDLTADADPSVPYRAPEARHGIALASATSDVYALALSLAGWVLGDLPGEPDVDRVREGMGREPVVGAVLAACLAADPGERPDAATAAKQIGQLIEEEEQQRSTDEAPEGKTEFRIGECVDGRYEIQESLGQGGFARTWRAWDSYTEADRVIKEFYDPISAVAKREYAAADRIRHDLCARVYDVRQGYLVLEYLPGVNLKEYASEDTPDADRYRDIALDVLAALAHLHSRDLLHRDITPTNVIITPEGRAKLIDFGVASRPEAKTAVVGTPAFMAPEVRAGYGADSRSDLYEFGVTMIYTMLGRFPYAGDPDRGDDDRTTLIPPTPDERGVWGQLGSALLNALFRAVDVNPEKRPSSADELATELRLVSDLPPGDGMVVINPVVNSLRGLYRASSVGNAGNRGLDDDFARDTYVDTLLDTELLPAILGSRMRLVLLTGNPGDGKTSFLVQVGNRLRSRGAREITADASGWRLSLDGHTFVAIYDASESHQGKSSDELMREALDPMPGEDPSRRTVLLAINDGRLLHFFTEHEDLYEEEFAEIRRQMGGTPPADPTIALVDLKRRTLAPWSQGRPSLSRRILASFTGPDLWQPCIQCLSRDICPMLRNAAELRGPARDAVDELVATSYLRRQRRATFRDVRSALGWLITGDRACTDVHAARERGMDLRRSTDALVEDLAFDPASADYLVREWSDLDPARTAVPDVERAARDDRNIVSDPVEFNDRDRERSQRQLFFGIWRPAGIDRGAVRVYRYLAEFDEALGTLPQERLDDTRARILLGLSRLLGAAGYRGSGLAVTDQDTGGTWVVLKEIPGEEFSLERVERPSSYVEWRPDALRLRHDNGGALTLTLDTFELVLRVADGDLIGDNAAGSVRQEIETFAAALRRSPATSVRVVNPAGMARRAEITPDRHIALERA